MKSVKVNGLEIRPPERSAFEYETAPDLPKLHMVCVCVGKRGAGKSCAVVNLIEQLQFDRVIVVSPTFSSNLELMKRLKVQKDDVIEDMTPAAVGIIRAKVDAERDDLERYQRELKDYNNAMQRVSRHHHLDALSDEFLWSMVTADGRSMLEPPKHKWGGRKPRIAVYVDDAIGSEIYAKPRQLNNLCILHRHIGQFKEGGSIGASLFFLVQSYMTCAGGLTKCIRNQATILLLFKSKNEKEIMEVAEECSGEVSIPTFLRVYEEATREPYSFLCVDLHKKDNHESMFRKCFSEFLLPPED